MSNSKDSQNLRFALEEINKFILYVDNFFWILSSFFIIGTAYSIYTAVDLYSSELKFEVLFLSGVMIILWVLYIVFSIRTYNKSENLYKRADDIENKLKINILSNDLIKTKDVNNGYKIRKNFEFRHIMYFIALVSILIFFLIFFKCLELL